MSILNNERLININEVCHILCRSRASIYRDIKRGNFPQAIKLGGSSRWRIIDVLEIINNGMEHGCAGTSKCDADSENSL